jgi:hypothetical protein
VDLIGPWKINVPNVGALLIRALTIIDTCTTLSELVRIDNRSAAHVAFKFEQAWLSCHPRPLCCIHDPSTEFTGANFQVALTALNIEPVPTTVKNPQANAICERMHNTCGDMIHTFLRENPPTNIETALELVNSVLAAAQWALRTCVHHILESLLVLLSFIETCSLLSLFSQTTICYEKNAKLLLTKTHAVPTYIAFLKTTLHQRVSFSRIGFSR